jgi:hypothetical protein
MNISKEQIKKAFVSDPKDIGEEAYNNQDWYQQDDCRMRYILATTELSPGDNYSEKPKQYELGQEDNRYYNCIEFGDDGEYQINDEHKLSLLMRMSEQELHDYIDTNEYDWIGDDYDHINEYLFSIMNYWQDEVEFDTEGYDNPDYLTVTQRAREWVRDGDFKSENKHEVAYQILMDYFDELPEETRAEAHKRLEAIEC